MAGKHGHRSWGRIRRLPSKRYQANYVGPDLVRHNAPATFTAKMDAEAWLAAERRSIELGVWITPAMRAAEKVAAAVTVGEYATTWIEQRNVKPRTRSMYTDLLRLHIAPTLGRVPVAGLTPDAVRSWYAKLGADHPRRNAHAYGLLHAFMATAATDGLIPSNPCHIARAMSVARKRQPVILSIAELATLADAVPEKLKAAILLSAWTGVRWGELIELRRKDMDAECEVLYVGRAATHRGGCRIDTPKSGKPRTVVIPPHARGDILHHLDTWVAKDREALVFPPDRGGHHLNDKVFRDAIAPALEKVGRGDLRIHDLRHFAGTMAARVGNLPETMARLGHSTVRASLLYQNIVSGRDAEVAAALSELAKDVGPE
jgi:integrase